MRSLAWSLLPCLVAAPGAAQGLNDINGLVNAAGLFANRRLAGTEAPPTLDLRLVRGQHQAGPDYLMQRAQDVQRWTFFYGATHTVPPPEPQASASVKCVKGVFGDFHFAAAPVPRCKTLEDTWIGIGMEAAVGALNRQGYVRGFTQVQLKRPDDTNVPPDLVYVFTCPYERTQVAISAASGDLVWYQVY